MYIIIVWYLIQNFLKVIMLASSYLVTFVTSNIELNFLYEIPHFETGLIFRGENGTNGCHLAGFSEDVAFAHHFVATRLSPPSHS